MVYIFLSIALALTLGKYFDNIILGYLIVAGITFLLGILVFINRHLIDNSIIKILSENYFDNDEDTL